MPSVGAQGSAIALIEFDLAVNGKHLFDEGTPEVKQAHRKRTFVLGSERDAPFLEILAEIGAKLYGRGRFPAARRSGFEQDAVGNLARSAVELLIGEAVVAPEPADGLALVGEEC